MLEVNTFIEQYKIMTKKGFKLGTLKNNILNVVANTICFIYNCTPINKGLMHFLG